jgi:hypothetical protein
MERPRRFPEAFPPPSAAPAKRPNSSSFQALAAHLREPVCRVDNQRSQSREYSCTAFAGRQDIHNSFWLLGPSQMAGTGPSFLLSKFGLGNGLKRRRGGDLPSVDLTERPNTRVAGHPCPASLSAIRQRKPERTSSRGLAAQSGPPDVLEFRKRRPPKCPSHTSVDQCWVPLSFCSSQHSRSCRVPGKTRPQRR